MKKLSRISMALAASMLVLAPVAAQAGTRASSAPVSITLPREQAAGADGAEVAATQMKFDWIILVLVMAVAAALGAAMGGGGGDGGTRSRG